jgi:hypothetical protein
MKVKALKRYILYTSSDIVSIPKDLYKTHVKTASFFAVNKKVTKELLLRKECNARYL